MIHASTEKTTTITFGGLHSTLAQRIHHPNPTEREKELGVSLTEFEIHRFDRSGTSTGTLTCYVMSGARCPAAIGIVAERVGVKSPLMVACNGTTSILSEIGRSFDAHGIGGLENTLQLLTFEGRLCVVPTLKGSEPWAVLRALLDRPVTGSGALSSSPTPLSLPTLLPWQLSSCQFSAWEGFSLREQSLLERAAVICKRSFHNRRVYHSFQTHSTASRDNRIEHVHSVGSFAELSSQEMDTTKVFRLGLPVFSNWLEAVTQRSPFALIKGAVAATRLRSLALCLREDLDHQAVATLLRNDAESGLIVSHPKEMSQRRALPATFTRLRTAAEMFHLREGASPHNGLIEKYFHVVDHFKGRVGIGWRVPRSTSGDLLEMEAVNENQFDHLRHLEYVESRERNESEIRLFTQKNWVIGYGLPYGNTAQRHPLNHNRADQLFAVARQGGISAITRLLSARLSECYEDLARLFAEVARYLTYTSKVRVYLAARTDPLETLHISLITPYSRLSYDRQGGRKNSDVITYRRLCESGDIGMTWAQWRGQVRSDMYPNYRWKGVSYKNPADSCMWILFKRLVSRFAELPA
jgi:hypothetical protein